MRRESLHRFHNLHNLYNGFLNTFLDNLNVLIIAVIALSNRQTLTEACRPRIYMNGETPKETVPIQAQVAQGWITSVNSETRFRSNATLEVIQFRRYQALISEGVV